MGLPRAALIFGLGEHLDYLRALAHQLLDLFLVRRDRHQASFSTSPKTARPAVAASPIEITLPRTSGCSASQRSAFAADTKKFSTGQQPKHESDCLSSAPATTTADSGHHSASPFGSQAFFLGQFIGRSEMIALGAVLTFARRRLLPAAALAPASAAG